MFYYSCYSCRGLAALAYDLNVNDPFALAPAEIVDRILTAGYTPVVELARSDPWSQAGTVTEVHRDGLVFLVAVSREEEMIGLQEARPDQHEPGDSRAFSKSADHRVRKIDEQSGA